MLASLGWELAAIAIILAALAQAQQTHFKLGLLCPRSHIRLGWDTNAAAATMAIAQAQQDGLLADRDFRWAMCDNYSCIWVLPNEMFSFDFFFQFSIIWRDDKCEGKEGVGQAVLFRDEDDIDMFLGPPCSACEPHSSLVVCNDLYLWTGGRMYMVLINLSFLSS
jgi:hypothetical protein